MFLRVFRSNPYSFVSYVISSFRECRILLYKKYIDEEIKRRQKEEILSKRPYNSEKITLITDCYYDANG